MAASRSAGGPRIVEQTVDIALLDRPLRSREDIQVIESIPLAEQIRVDNFCRRVDLAIATRAPNDIAIHYVESGDVRHVAQEISFAALRANIDRTAALLRARGIGRNDVVAILLPGVPDIYWSLLGAMAAGIAFPINWMMEANQILHLLRDSKAKAVIALGPTPGYTIWESLKAIAPQLPVGLPIFSVPGPGGTHDEETDLERLSRQPSPPWNPDLIEGDDIAAYVHSGGTTGTPKIIKLSHRGLSYRHWTVQLTLKLETDDVFVHDTPMFHVGGLIGRVLSALASGATMVIPSAMGARDRQYMANFWKFIEKYGVTRVSAVPTTLASLIKTPPTTEDVSSLKPYSLTGSTALPQSVQLGFEAITGVRMLNTYGMTENTSAVSIDPRDGPIRGSGLPMPYTKVRTAVVNDAGDVTRLCAPNEIGMLLVSGPGVTPGFVNSAHERGAFTSDGWIISGDLGRIDEDGYIFVTGRAKDVIIRGGHNIDPALIEEPLTQSPDVLLAAAVGKPDAYAGELPVAYVQLSEGSRATPAQLADFLQGRIGERAAIPKDIFIIDKLPLTAVGKPLKNELRLDAAERVFRGVLSDAGGEGKATVRVEPDPTSGTIATITLACPDGERAGLEARIKVAMAPFAMAHRIV